MGLGWLVIALVAAVSLVVQLGVSVVALIAGPRGINLVLLPGGALFWWWVHRGAWLRTRWGRPPEGTLPPWVEPGLSDRRAGWYVWLAAACVVSAAIAISLQATNWVD